MPENCKLCLVQNSSSELFNVLHVDSEEFNLSNSLRTSATITSNTKLLLSMQHGVLVKGWRVLGGFLFFFVVLKFSGTLACHECRHCVCSSFAGLCGTKKKTMSLYQYALTISEVFCLHLWLYVVWCVLDLSRLFAIVKVNYIRIQLKPVAAMSMSRNRYPLSHGQGGQLDVF